MLPAMEIERRAVGPNDVLLDILYCGICHSDIHQVRDEWNAWGPTVYPCVPGHEIIGRVVAVGDKVIKFKVGDIGGVGCMVDSCRTTTRPTSTAPARPPTAAIPARSSSRNAL
jgi:alcohol dehydrogenase (NADP+)